MESVKLVLNMCQFVQSGFMVDHKYASRLTMMIDKILDEIETHIDPFALCSLRQNATLNLERNHSGTLHYVLSGEGMLQLDRGHRIKLTEGMLVLVPSGQQHTLRGGKRRCTDLPQCSPLELHLAHLPTGDLPRQDTNLFLLCAYVDIALRGFHNVLYGVTKPIVFDTRTDHISSVLMPLVISELSAPRFGGKSTVRSLLWVAFIQLLRSAALEAGSELRQELRILKEPRLLPAVQAVLEDPKSAHTVESLAELAVMSRSAFAGKFQAAYGVGPMEFLRQHRVESAARLLGNPTISVKRAAHEVGFGSRNAFSRAFRSVMGCSPQAFRRRKPDALEQPADAD